MGKSPADGTALRRRVTTVFDRCKRKSRRDPLVRVPIHDDAGALCAHMRPITADFRRTDPGLADLLGRWRRENPTLATATFRVTRQRTLRWLDRLIIGRADRLLFLLEALDGRLVGHLGYSNFDFRRGTGEIDCVLRGVKKGYPGIMTHAMIALLKWGQDELGLTKIRLSTFDDNESAIRFYEKLGFSRDGLKPLIKVKLPGEVKWELAPDGYDGPVEKYYVYMRFDKKKCPPRIRKRLR